MDHLFDLCKDQIDAFWGVLVMNRFAKFCIADEGITRDDFGKNLNKAISELSWVIEIAKDGREN